MGGLFEASFFVLAGIGVRERSRAAAIIAFSAYLLSAAVLQRYTGNGFGIVRIIFLALLFANIRGNILSSRWAKDPSSDLPSSIRLNQTFMDKLVDQMPALIWPKARVVFYIFALIELSLLLIGLFAPRS